MDPAGIALAVFGTIVELYKISMKTYDLYLSIQDFTPAFRELGLALKIERKRLELWAQHMGLEKESGMNDRLRNDSTLLEIIQEIFENMVVTFNDSTKMTEEYTESLPTQSEFDLSTHCTSRSDWLLISTWTNHGRYRQAQEERWRMPPNTSSGRRETRKNSNSLSKN